MVALYFTKAKENEKNKIFSFRYPASQNTRPVTLPEQILSKGRLPGLSFLSLHDTPSFIIQIVVLCLHVRCADWCHLSTKASPRGLLSWLS